MFFYKILLVAVSVLKMVKNLWSPFGKTKGWEAKMPFKPRL